MVIGHQGENVWVSTGGEAVLVAPEQLREAHKEELWEPGLDELTMHDTLMQLHDKISTGEYDGVDERGAGPGPEDEVEPRRDIDGHVDLAKEPRRRYTYKR